MSNLAEPGSSASESLSRPFNWAWALLNCSYWGFESGAHSEPLSGYTVRFDGDISLSKLAPYTVTFVLAVKAVKDAVA